MWYGVTLRHRRLSSPSSFRLVPLLLPSNVNHARAESLSEIPRAWMEFSIRRSIRTFKENAPAEYQFSRFLLISCRHHIASLEYRVT
ncbi:hypothetical protein EV356DRAFT_253474 [Viridothelium virens]|uniref:Uncharacterized protein n=1 Tax=Viridothelium virens TaxID=1048519 RepID=A0A6A6H302_VIRVR|nr:hypothetical protein EV356DRAFT_253474 [Viridothelium virens]